MQIFAQATLNGRYAEGQKVYSAVKDRHDEIKRIEKTLVELAQLFTDVCISPRSTPLWLTNMPDISR